MKIFGVDFTSAPGPKKPITCASCFLRGNRLFLDQLRLFYSWKEFDELLHEPGPWLLGLDFPFGQPRKFLENAGWPLHWTRYVDTVSKMSIRDFVHILDDYRKDRPEGDKQHLRETDRLARACSPMMVYGVPVGRMFFRGAPRLLSSPISVLPCRPTEDKRIAIEVYPALVARFCAGNASYKNDARHKQSETQQLVRKRILSALQTKTIQERYGILLENIAPIRQELVDDPGADLLDAILCAVQTAWASCQVKNNYGIPHDCDSTEGWIVDPILWH